MTKDSDLKLLVERLKPRYIVDELFAVIVRHLRSEGAEESAKSLTEFIVANNALKAEAVTALTAAESKLEEMRSALEPFARAAALVEHVGDNSPAGGWVVATEEERELIPRVKHLRAAKRALGEQP